MTDLQKTIKTSIESSFFNLTGEKIVVEFVPDVSKRADELLEKIGVDMHHSYEANHYTGTFMPATNNSPHYILIEEERKDHLDVMSSFHELQHAMDYVRFLAEIFEGNQNAMIKSKIYVTFQAYSELTAIRFGVANYLSNVEFSGMTKKEFANCVLETYKRDYLDFSNIINKWQLVIHTFEYLGVLLAIEDILPDFDLDEAYKVMQYYNEFKPIFDLLDAFVFTKDWFIQFDEEIRYLVG